MLGLDTFCVFIWVYLLCVLSC